MSLNFNQKYIKPIIFALLHFLITTITGIDRAFFNYPDVIVSHLIFIKILYCIFLIFGYTFIFEIVRKIKEGDSLYIRGAKIFGIYFSVLFILILAVWPGLWSIDDVFSLQREVRYNFLPWAHVITSIKNLLFLQVIPCAGGIIIMQNIIIAVCVAFSVVKLENTFGIFLKNKFFDYAFKLLPFLMFPVLRYQLSGYRMGMYIYVELVMLVMLLCALKDKEQWSIKYSALFVFLSVISTVWRMESIFYLPFTVILLLFFMKHISALKIRVIMSVFIIAGVLGIIMVQRHYFKHRYNYQIMSTLHQAAKLIPAADSNKDADILKGLNKVIKIKVVYDYPNEGGDLLYWNRNIMQKNYDASDYREYLAAFFKLCLKYPKVLIKERIDLFIDSSGLHGNIIWLNNIAILNLYSGDINQNIISPFFISLAMKSPLNRPINLNIRNDIAHIIMLDRHGFLFKIVWNFIPPVIVFFIFWFFLLLRKQWKFFLLMSAVTAKFFVVFVTAPGTWFMYYLPFYLIGYIILVFGLMYVFTLRREKASA